MTLTAPPHCKPSAAATVRDPTGKALKIPPWMLEPAAARYRLGDVVTLPADVLLALASLVDERFKVTAPSSPEPSHDTAAEEANVFIADHHEGYITWADYQRHLPIVSDSGA